MKQRHEEKLKKYMKNGNLAKIKHLRRKHDLDLASSLLENKNTFLHLACEYGQAQIVKYLEKHGCSLLQQNSNGDLPLHKACHFFMKQPKMSVYDSLIIPLKRMCPESLLVKNKTGITASELLQQACRNHTHPPSPVTVDSCSDDSDSVIYLGEESATPRTCKQTRGRGGNSNVREDQLVGLLQRSIEEGDLSAIKRLKKDPRITVQITVFEDGNTPLHTAADWGQDAVLRYLLAEGCDPLLVNCDGELPLHRACSFAKETDRIYVYRDLLEPLVSAAPDSVNLENNRGRSCRDSITLIKSRALNACSREESDLDSDGEGNFCRKLFEEMMSEYGEEWGDYEQDFREYGSTTEDTGSWMDRMAKERKRKHHYSSNYTESKKKKTPDTDRSADKPGRISDEQKEEFNQKLKEQHAKDARKNAKQKTLEKRLRYELKCETVFKKKTSVSLLSYDDIPWPHDHGKTGTAGDIADFLFGEMDRTGVEYGKYVKVQQVRWHPDRFLQRCGDRLKAGEKEEIMKRVNEISQVLNALNK